MSTYDIQNSKHPKMVQHHFAGKKGTLGRGQRIWQIVDSGGRSLGFPEWYLGGDLKTMVALHQGETFVPQAEFSLSNLGNVSTQDAEVIHKQAYGGEFPYCTDAHLIHYPPNLQQSLQTQLPDHEDQYRSLFPIIP